MNSRKSSITSSVKLARLGYWPTASTFFVVGLALAVVFVATVAFLWLALTQIGILEQIDAKVASVAGEGAFSLTEALTLPKTLAVAGIFGGLLAGLAPLAGLVFAGIYNGSARLSGGVEFTFVAPLAVADEPARLPDLK